MIKTIYQLTVCFLTLCLCASSWAGATIIDEDPVILLAAKSSSETQIITAQLRSFSSIEKRRAAITIHRYHLHNKKLIALVEDELLKGYRIRTRDRRYIDAMAWMCNVLGDSGNPKYAETLGRVASSAKNRKVRSYASRNYRKVR
jgi:hypothetical protein